MSGRSVGSRVLVAVSFLTLSLGFLIGLRVGREGGSRISSVAPHAVGAEEYARLGMQALAAGDMVEAERRFREAVALRPEEPGPRVDLAVALMSQGRWEEADRELAEAKRIAPDLPAVWFLEGWIAWDGFGDTLRTRRVWERFLELAPPDAPQAAEVRRWLAESEAEKSGG